MPAKLPTSVQNLIDSFARLPGIGPKMASRLTFHLLQKSAYDINRFISALEGIQNGINDCAICGHIAEAEHCAICTDDQRSARQICVVEGPLDVIALEKTGSYTGRYHVLGGVLSPIDGIGPDQLRIRLLIERLQNSEESIEIIIATNPSLEGEATAGYIQQQLQNNKLLELHTLTRIARGLPMGSDLEYADPATLLRALEGRRSL